MKPQTAQKKLLAAIGRNDMAGIDACLAAGASLYAAGDDGFTTPFAVAVRAGNTDIITGLIEGGADPNYQVAVGVSPPPLVIAVVQDLRDGLATRTALLLAKGARPDVRFTYNEKDGQTVADVLQDVLPFAIPPEDVTIRVLQSHIDKAHAVMAEKARSDLVARQKRNRKKDGYFKL